MYGHIIIRMFDMRHEQPSVTVTEGEDIVFTMWHY